MQKKIMVQELKKLAIYYQQAKRSPEEIMTLASMWYEDMSDIPDQDFITAIKLYRRNNDFFPTSNQIRGCYRIICRDRNDRKDVKILPFPEETPEEIEKRKKFIKDLRILKRV